MSGYLGDTGMWAYGAIDTTITIRVTNFKPCWEPRKLHRMEIGWLESAEARAAEYPTGDDAPVFDAVLDQVAHTPVVLLNKTRKHCVLADQSCGGAQLARLENIGIIDSSTVHDFLVNADSSIVMRPSFARERSHDIITHTEIRYLIGEVEPYGDGTSSLADHDYYHRHADDLLFYSSFWNAFHRLYGKTTKLVSLTRIGFNASRTQALVQVLAATTESDTPALVLLAKRDGRWRVERPAIEREENSGSLEGGRCVWKSIASPTVKPRIEKIRGDFRITQIGMSPTPEVEQFTLRLLPDSSGHASGAPRTHPATPAVWSARGDIYRANGERDPDVEARLGSDSTTTFIDVRLAGGIKRLLQRFEIHEIRGGNFYGSWQPPDIDHFPVDSSRGGIANPGGYFCAERLSGSGK